MSWSWVGTEYSIHRVQHTLSTAFTEYCIHRVLHHYKIDCLLLPASLQVHLQSCSITASKFISKLARSQPSSVSLNSPDYGVQVHLQTRSISIAYSEYSTLWVQHTPSIAYIKYSIHQVQHTLSTAFTEYSIHPILSVFPSFSWLRVDPWM